MRDHDLERLFERVGQEARPDAEFEEDLLLRLEAHLADLDPELDRDPAKPVPAPDPAPVIEIDLFDDHRKQRRRRLRALATVAAVVSVIAGVAALTTAIRESQPEGPAATTPPTLPSTAPLQQSTDALCVRHADELARIDELGSPLEGTLVSPAVEEERAQLLGTLDAIVDDYRITLAAIESVAPAISDELAAIEDDLDNELAFVARGRFNGARYSIPSVVDRLLAINALLADAGASSCR